MSGRLRTGTSGFAYPAWAPRFYPAGLRGDGLLLACDLTAERAPDVVRLGIDEGVLLNATGPTTIP